MEQAPQIDIEQFRADSERRRTFKPSSVVVVGNGAIVGGNEALELAISRHKEKWVFGDTQKSDIFLKSLSAEKYLAIMAYIGRVGKKYLVRAFEFENPSEDLFVRAAAPLRIVQGLREEICRTFEEFRESRKLLLRELPSQVQNCLNEKDHAVITTNWDRTIFEDSRIGNACAIHGQVTFSKSLLLPAEYSIDAGYFKAMFEKFRWDEAYKKHWDLIIEITDVTSHETLVNNDAMRNWLINCKKLVLWGTALNTYDSELLGIMTEAFLVKKNREDVEVTCINRASDISAFETAKALCGSDKFIEVRV